MGIPFRLLITLLFTYVLSPPTLQVKDPSKGQGYCAPSSQSCSELPDFRLPHTVLSETAGSSRFRKFGYRRKKGP